MQNDVALAAMVGLIAFLVWSGVRAWRAKRPLARWGGVVLATTLAVPLSGVSASFGTSVRLVHAWMSVSAGTSSSAPSATRRAPGQKRLRLQRVGR